GTSRSDFQRLNSHAPAGFPSGQRGRTVNPLAQPSQVRILLPPFSEPRVPAHATADYLIRHCRVPCGAAHRSSESGRLDTLRARRPGHTVAFRRRNLLMSEKAVPRSGSATNERVALGHRTSEPSADTHPDRTRSFRDERPRPSQIPLSETATRADSSTRGG